MAQIQLTNFGDSQLASGIYRRQHVYLCHHRAWYALRSLPAVGFTRFSSIPAATTRDRQGYCQGVWIRSQSIARAEGTTALAFAVGSVFPPLRLTRLQSVQDYLGVFVERTACRRKPATLAGALHLGTGTTSKGYQPAVLIHQQFGGL